jgi:hypothetical protein
VGAVAVTESESERRFREGYVCALRGVLGQTLSAILPQYENALVDDRELLARAVLELSEARSTLRRICARWGDNDWEVSLNLSDVLEKHLESYLGASHRSALEWLQYHVLGQDFTGDESIDAEAVDLAKLIMDLRRGDNADPTV